MKIKERGKCGKWKIMEISNCGKGKLWKLVIGENGNGEKL